MHLSETACSGSSKVVVVNIPVGRSTLFKTNLLINHSNGYVVIDAYCVEVLRGKISFQNVIIPLFFKRCSPCQRRLDEILYVILM